MGAILVDTYQNLENKESLQEWRQLLDDKTMLPDGRPIPIVLFYNKCDLNDTGSEKNQQED